MQSNIRSSFTGPIKGLDSKYNQLASVGIRSGANGQLSIKNNSALEEALRENLDEVIRLFTDSGSSNSTFFEFISSTSDTKVGSDYEVNITQAATRGRFQGSGITDPGVTPLTLTSANNRLKFLVDGLHSDEIILAEKTYQSSEELVKEIQEKIDNDEKIGSRGLAVEWVNSGSGMGYLNLTSSTYGSGSKVGLITSVPSSAFAALGLVTGISHDGLDVEGTINGEAATGSGQTLTGNEGNATTDGLKIKVTLTPEALIDGAEGTVTVTKGVAARLNATLQSLTAAGDGLLDSRIRAYQNQIQHLQERIADIDELLAKRRERLQDEFNAMELTLGELSSTSTYLESQLDNLKANWVIGKPEK
jgi:flagellar hook-associated protein 2